ncbi:MAG: zinc-binding dehydrogenase [Candidatus Helarchaeota archaeon]
MYEAAVLFEPKKIRMEEKEDLIPNKNEAIINVRSAGICGTDLAIYSGDYPVPLPLVLGHEFSGDIIKVGNESIKELIGKRVTSEINNTCISYNKNVKCAACEIGLNTHCQDRSVLGIIGYDGAFAEQIKVPINNIHILPDEISYDAATFIEPLAAAIQTFELAPIQENDLVIIFGLGRLGILINLVAKSIGARVLAISRSKEKLERAQKFGADHTVSNLNDLIIKTSELTNGLGADMVVECTGISDMINEAIKCVRPRGIIALKSTSGITAHDIDTTKIVVDEIKVIGSRCGPFNKAIKMIKNENLNLERFISKIYPLNEVEIALKTAKEEFKVLIH